MDSWLIGSRTGASCVRTVNAAFFSATRLRSCSLARGYPSTADLIHCWHLGVVGNMYVLHSSMFWGEIMWRTGQEMAGICCPSSDYHFRFTIRWETRGFKMLFAAWTAQCHNGPRRKIHMTPWTAWTTAPCVLPIESPSVDKLYVAGACVGKRRSLLLYLLVKTLAVTEPVNLMPTPESWWSAACQLALQESLVRS